MSFIEKMDENIEEAYAEFKAKYDTLLKEDKDSEDFIRSQKINTVRNILSNEFGQDFGTPTTLFPTFYCQDLIVFGLTNNIPEAVRIGEKMMSAIG